MQLSSREQEKLMIFTAAEVARKIRERGLKLNHPEAEAITFGGYGYDYTATLYACAPKSLSDLAENPHSTLDGLPGTLASASAPEHGPCAARILAHSAPALYQALNAVRREVRGYLALSPPTRDLRWRSALRTESRGLTAES